MDLNTTLRKAALPMALVAGAAVIMLLLSALKKDQERKPPKPFVRTAFTQTAQYAAVRPLIQSMGRVSAFERVSLTPEVSGIIQPGNFGLRKGRSFKKGQALLQIDNRQASYAFHSAVSDLQNALTGLLPELKNDLPDAFDAWENFFAAIGRAGLPAVPEASTEREKLLATRFNVYKLYYTAKNLEVTLAKHTLTAPFDGAVEESSVFPASMARAGTPVATLIRTDLAEIELALTEHDAKYVEPGMAARISGGNGNAVTGKVNRVGNFLDPKLQTVPAFVRVNHAAGGGLLSGGYVSVAVEGTTIPRAFALPRKAVHQKDRVYVIEKGRLAERKIEIAYLGLETVYVSGGVDQGLEVIAEPLQDAVIGMEVRSVRDN